MKFAPFLILVACAADDDGDGTAVQIPVGETGTTDPDDPTTPDTGPGDETIADLNVYYMSSAIDCEYTTAWLEVKVFGLPDEVLFDIYETGQDSSTYFETHQATLEEAGDRFSVWTLDLIAGGPYVDGEATSFSCSNMARQARWVSYSVRLYDQAELADCNIFGSDPEQVLDNPYRPEDVTIRNCEIDQ